MKIQGYILDTNHVSALFSKRPDVVQKIQSLPADTQLRASVVTLAEVDWGCLVTSTTNQERRDEYLRFVNETFLPNAIGITSATRTHYVKIMAGIWKIHQPKKGVGTEQHLVSLRVDINDVWVAATAMEHGLILVTQDKIECIKESAEGTLKTDNWIIPTASPPPSSR